MNVVECFDVWSEVVWWIYDDSAITSRMSCLSCSYQALIGSYLVPEFPVHIYGTFFWPSVFSDSELQIAIRPDMHGCIYLRGHVPAPV